MTDGREWVLISVAIKEANRHTNGDDYSLAGTARQIVSLIFEGLIAVRCGKASKVVGNVETASYKDYVIPKETLDYLNLEYRMTEPQAAEVEPNSEVFDSNLLTSVAFENWFGIQRGGESLIFNEVRVDRVDLIRHGLVGEQHINSPKGRTGRPVGSGLEEADKPYVEEALNLIIAGEANSAANAVTKIIEKYKDQIAGHSPEAKLDRLSRRVNLLRNRGNNRE